MIIRIWVCCVKHHTLMCVNFFIETFFYTRTFIINLTTSTKVLIVRKYNTHQRIAKGITFFFCSNRLFILEFDPSSG